MRVVLKISGEALMQDGVPISEVATKKLAKMIQELKSSGLEIVIVTGGGNIYRGSKLIAAGVNSSDSHNMSMLSTVFNGVALKNFLEKLGEKVTVLDALGVGFLEPFTANSAKKYLSEGQIVISTSGSGTPFFTTDTAGVLRALEVGADAIVKLTQVDGVYDSDPKKNPRAQKFDTISYNEYLNKKLEVFDQTGVILARDNELPVYISQLTESQDVRDLLSGKNVGTKIS